MNILSLGYFSEYGARATTTTLLISILAFHFNRRRRDRERTEGRRRLRECTAAGSHQIKFLSLPVAAHHTIYPAGLRTSND